MKLGCCLLILGALLGLTWARHNRHDVRVAKTVGHVWPQPQTIVSQTTVLQLDPITFYFQNGDGCEVIDSAFYRYQQLIFRPPLSSDSNSVPAFNYLNWQPSTNESRQVGLDGELQSLVVHLTGECETWPSLYMDEQYQLKIDTSEIPQKGALIAASVWGVLRGLETFSQLIYKDHDTGLFLINSTFIIDFPRFSHRGILMDTSRHYVPLHLIKENLDAMAYNKFNVFHWHIVDDQSFPYQSRRFPNMSDLGAYEPIHHIYTFNDIQDVIDYARLRGIRVVPEFDTPGHTLSWGAGITQLLTQCYNTTTGKPINGKFGPVNPILQSTYDFLAEFFAEAISLFPDKYIHLGGDEVPFDCWQSNPYIQNFMTSMNFTDYRQLESYYMSNLLSSTEQLNVSSIVWQEVFDNGVGLSNDTVIEVWKSGGMPEIAAVTAAGYRAVYASCWYLDIVNAATDWSKFYLCDPQDFSGSQKQMDLVIGGEACLWGEYVDGSNLVARMWPRASAAGERLWSNKTQTSVSEAAPRLEEMRCRLMTRGISAEPQNGPGFCDVDYLL